jgi:hypothetical protein
MYQVSYNSRYASVQATPSAGETVLEHFETTEESQFLYSQVRSWSVSTLLDSYVSDESLKTPKSHLKTLKTLRIMSIRF